MKIRRLRRRHTIAAMAAGTAAGLLLAACGTTGSSSGGTAASSTRSLPHTIVFSPLSLQIPALKGLATGLQAYAKGQQWTVQLQDPAYNAGTQQTQLSAVISSGVAGALWILAVNPSALTTTLKAAEAKGIPVLVNGVPSDYGFSGLQPGIIFDVIDYKAAGTALGQQLGACINKKLGGTAEVLFSRDPVGSVGKADLENSAVAALHATAPKATIVSNLDESAQATAQTDVGNALQGHPGINAVMAVNDEGTLGAVGAFAAAGKSLTCATGFGGGNAQVLTDLKSGMIYAVVQQQFTADMVQSFKALAAMQADPKKVGPQLHTPQKILTAGQ